jgi:hypothetical protein
VSLFCTFEQEDGVSIPALLLIRETVCLFLYFLSGKRCLYFCTSVDHGRGVSISDQGNGVSISAFLLIMETVSLFLIKETASLFLEFLSGKRCLYPCIHFLIMETVSLLLIRETVSLFPQFF